MVVDGERVIRLDRKQMYQYRADDTSRRRWVRRESPVRSATAAAADAEVAAATAGRGGGGGRRSRSKRKLSRVRPHPGLRLKILKILKILPWVVCMSWRADSEVLGGA